MLVVLGMTNVIESVHLKDVNITLFVFSFCSSK